MSPELLPCGPQLPFEGGLQCAAPGTVDRMTLPADGQSVGQAVAGSIISVTAVAAARSRCVAPLAAVLPVARPQSIEADEFRFFFINATDRLHDRIRCVSARLFRRNRQFRLRGELAGIPAT